MILSLVVALVVSIAGAAPGEPPRAPQDLVDAAIFQIMSSQTGQRALCPFTESDRAMELYIGASAAASRKIKTLCGGRYITPVTKHTVWMMSSTLLNGGLENAPGKSWFQHKTIPEKYRGIMSYTNAWNNTFFLMTAQEMADPVELIRVVAHEYAMSYDRLARLGYLSDPTTWEQGLNLAFGKTTYTPELNFQDMSLAEVRVLNCALRYALATERAYRFEDQVIKDLGLEKISPPVAVGSFQKAISRFAKLYAPFSEIIRDEAVVYDGFCNKRERGTRQELFQRRQNLLETLELRFRNSNESMLMSDLLVRPFVGPFMRDSEGGGPRPKPGFGDGE